MNTGGRGKEVGVGIDAGQRTTGAKELWQLDTLSAEGRERAKERALRRFSLFPSGTMNINNLRKRWCGWTRRKKSVCRYNKIRKGVKTSIPRIQTLPLSIKNKECCKQTDLTINFF